MEERMMEMLKRIFLMIMVCFMLFSCSKENTMTSQLDSNNLSSDEIIFEHKAVHLSSSDYDTRSLTLMIYMIGSDLEASTAAASNDLEEMRESGINLDKVDLLVYTGGSPKWHSDVPNDKNVIYHLTENGFEEVEVLEATSMGKPESLSNFLEFGYDNYKNDAYALILWDHGNGPVMGYGLDKQFDNDALTLPEMAKALELSPFGMNQKLEFIGFDACLMASIELACVVCPYTNYLVASQETEPSFGWCYDFLKNAHIADTEALISNIVDYYVEYSVDYYAEQPFFNSDVTLAAMNIQNAEVLGEKIDELFALAAKNVSGDYINLAGARVQTRSLGRASTGSEYDLVDLGSLMNQMSKDYPQQVEEIVAIAQSMILNNRSNTLDCSGMSMYYPFYNKKYYERSWKEAYTELGLFPNYLTYLERYEKIWLGTDMKQYFNQQMIAEENEKGVYTLRLSSEQAERLARVGYYILSREGTDAYSIVYRSNNVTKDDSLLTANFDGNIIYCSTNYEDKFIPLILESDHIDDMTYYHASVVLEKEIINSDYILADVQFSFNAQTEQFEMVGVYADDNSTEIKSGKKKEIDPNDFGRATFYYIKPHHLTRDENGIIINYWDWIEEPIVFGHSIAVEDGFFFTYEPMYEDGKEYFLMFDMTDVQGNVYNSELLPISLSLKPEEEKSEVNEIDWENGDSIKILEDKNVNVSLKASKNIETGLKEYVLYAENNNDYDIDVRITPPCINEHIYGVEGNIQQRVEPGENAYKNLSTITLLCMQSGITDPESFEFDVSVIKDNTYATLIPKQRVRIKLGEDIEFKPSLIPLYGLHSEKLDLIDNETLKLTLLGCGQNIGKSSFYRSLDSYYCLESHEDELMITVYGYKVDGIFLNSYETIQLDSGMETYFMTSIGENQFENSEIFDAKNIELLMRINDGPIESYSIQFKEDVIDNTSGELLFESEDGKVSIYLEPENAIEYRDSFISSFPVAEIKWNLWIDNRSDVDYYFNLEDKTANGQSLEFENYDADNPSFNLYNNSDNLLPSHSKACYDLTYRAKDDDQFMNTKLNGTIRWYTQNPRWYEAESSGETEAFIMEVRE